MKLLQSKLMALGLLTSIGLGSVGVAVAQEAGNSQTTPSTTISRPATPLKEKHARGPNKEIRAQRLDSLKKSLHLTAAQEPAWATFAEGLQPPADFAPRGAHDDFRGKQMTTPERIERHQQMQKRMMEHMNKRNDAVLAFYNQLNDTQKATFDQEFRPAHGGPARAQHGRHAHEGKKRGELQNPAPGS